MANILNQYGIKEVADVTFYNVDDNGNPGSPALYLDTLKVSTIEQTAEQADAKGGKGNPPLVVWDYGKEINVTLEDALFSPKSLEIMWGGSGLQEKSNIPLQEFTFNITDTITIPNSLPVYQGENNIAELLYKYGLNASQYHYTHTYYLSKDKINLYFNPLMKKFYGKVLSNNEDLYKLMTTEISDLLYSDSGDEDLYNIECVNYDLYVNGILKIDHNRFYSESTYLGGYYVEYDEEIDYGVKEGYDINKQDKYYILEGDPTLDSSYNIEISSTKNPATIPLKKDDIVRIVFYAPWYTEENTSVSDEGYLTFNSKPVVNSSTINVSPNTFPGVYYVVGDTYARSAITGDDEFFQFIIPKAKVQSENTLTMEAEGDPSVFSMNLRVLRPASGAMMKLVKYDLATETPTIDFGSNSNVSGPSQAQAQGSDNNDPVDPDPDETEEDPEGE